MFVAKWSPCLKPTKPKLSTVSVWLEFRHVPFQFFSEEGLEHIAGLVGHPLFLHPTTANMTNIEVTKVYTVNYPRKLFLEAINARFGSGEVVRVTVSSPWLPSLCSHYKKVGHTISKCLKAPVTCEGYKLVKHSFEDCPRAKRVGERTSRADKGK